MIVSQPSPHFHGPKDGTHMVSAWKYRSFNGLRGGIRLSRICAHSCSICIVIYTASLTRTIEGLGLTQALFSSDRSPVSMCCLQFLHFVGLVMMALFSPTDAEGAECVVISNMRCMAALLFGYAVVSASSAAATIAINIPSIGAGRTPVFVKSCR